MSYFPGNLSCALFIIPSPEEDIGLVVDNLAQESHCFMIWNKIASLILMISQMRTKYFPHSLLNRNCFLLSPTLSPSLSPGEIDFSHSHIFPASWNHRVSWGSLWLFWAASSSSSQACLGSWIWIRMLNTGIASKVPALSLRVLLEHLNKGLHWRGRVGKMARQEDPELTSSHGHTKIAPVYREAV